MPAIEESLGGSQIIGGTSNQVADQSQENSADGPNKKETDLKQNYNMRAAVIHLIGDMVQSIGVITASLLIFFKPEWSIADPICTFLFSFLVMLTTVPIMRDCTKILMEGTPDEIDVEKLYNEILTLKYVEEVHDFHCWSLGGGKYVLTCHVRSAYPDSVLKAINLTCRKEEYKIFHTTIQVEPERKEKNGPISCDHIA